VHRKVDDDVETCEEGDVRQDDVPGEVGVHRESDVTRVGKSHFFYIFVCMEKHKCGRFFLIKMKNPS